MVISCLCSVFVQAHTTPCMEALRLTGMALSFVHMLVSDVVSLSSPVFYSVIGLLNFNRCKHSGVLLRVSSIEHLLCQQCKSEIQSLHQKKSI